MVVVVELWWVNERQMVPTVVHDGDGHSDSHPQPLREHVGAEENGAELERDVVRREVLDGVRVVWHDADGSGPLVVLLVVQLVQRAPVYQSVERERFDVLH